MTDTKITVKDIPMAGWFKVKEIDLEPLNYEAGGFKSPYKAKAVLAVNSASATSGYIYTDNNGVQKIKLFAGATEASGEVTAELFLLVE